MHGRKVRLVGSDSTPGQSRTHASELRRPRRRGRKRMKRLARARARGDHRVGARGGGLQQDQHVVFLRRQRGRDAREVRRDREGRGRAQPDRLARLHAAVVVKPFEQETGCKVKVKYGNTSDEMVNLMNQQGGSLYDGVSASGDATNRLIASGAVAADRYHLVPRVPRRHADPAGAGPQHGGRRALRRAVHVGPERPDVQHGRREADAHQLGRRVRNDDQRRSRTPTRARSRPTTARSTSPTRRCTSRRTSPASASPTRTSSPQPQLDAAVTLLKQQAPHGEQVLGRVDGRGRRLRVGRHGRRDGMAGEPDVLVGDKKVPVASVTPSEGVTGWADTWMMSSHAPHPNCMLKWMEYTLRASVQTQVAEYYGATPSNKKSCAQLNKDLGADAATTTAATTPSCPRSTCGRRRWPRAATGRPTAWTTTPGQPSGRRSGVASPRRTGADPSEIGGPRGPPVRSARGCGGGDTRAEAGRDPARVGVLLPPPWAASGRHRWGRPRPG